MVETMKRIGGFFGTVMVFLLVAFVIWVVAQVHKYFGGNLPLTTTIALLVTIVSFMVMVVASLRHKPTWQLHILVLFSLCVGVYLFAVNRSWTWPYLGALIGLVLWIPFMLVDLRLRKFTKKSAKKPTKADGKKDEFNAVINVDNPNGKKGGGLIDLSSLFARVEEDIDLQKIRALNDSMEKVTAFIGQLFAMVQGKMISERQFFAALDKLGVAHLFHVEEPQEEKKELVLMDLDDDPRM